MMRLPFEAVNSLRRGVAAELLVVLEDEDFRVGLLLAVEEGGREPGNAAADHDEIVGLAGRGWRRRALPEGAVAHGVHHRHRGFGMAAHPGELCRITRGRCAEGGVRREAAEGGTADRQRDAVHEVAPADRAIHAEWRSRSESAMTKLPPVARRECCAFAEGWLVDGWLEIDAVVSSCGVASPRMSSAARWRMSASLR